MTESERTPAVIYAAKSTEDKHGSIPTQVADCRRVAEREGWEVADDYSDEAKSAYHGSRGNGLADAKRHAERIAPCVLIVQHTDRLARGDGVKGAHLVEVVLWARKAGVTIRSVQDDSTCASMGFAGMMGDRNYEDSKRKGESVQSGLRRRVVERRQFIGGRRPYGYRYEAWLDEAGKRCSRIVPDQAEAAVLRRICRETLAGVPQRSVAIALNEDKVPTLTGGRWYATTVAGLLRNPLYVGQVTYRGEHYPGDHAPIIDQETWDQVQALREARTAQGRPRGRRTAGSHVLTEGLLRCPTCRGAMSPVTKRDKRAANGQGYETYSCVERLHHGANACAQRPIKRAAIDAAIFDYFEKNFLDVDATRDLLIEQVNQALASEGSLHEQAEHELANAEAALKRIEGDYIAGKIGAEAWARFAERLRGEVAAAHAQAEQHRRQREAVKAIVGEFDAQAVVARELVTLRQRIVGEVREGRDDLDRFRTLLRRLFESFELAESVDGYLLLPLPRVLRLADGRWDFEGAGRGALDFSDNLCARLAAW